MKIVAFKTGKPKSFNYKPLYYNKEKEEMEERLKQLSTEPNPDQINEEKLRSRMRNSWGKHDVKAKSLTSKALYIYVLVVVALLYYIFIR
ncbi:MAG: hypothetical protein RBS07_06540 [Lentimicrobium sp.]|jgi:hypothetical protein|nr:hypothetical protein [Lentimicrobium sp.]